MIPPHICRRMTCVDHKQLRREAYFPFSQLLVLSPTSQRGCAANRSSPICLCCTTRLCQGTGPTSCVGCRSAALPFHGRQHRPGPGLRSASQLAQRAQRVRAYVYVMPPARGVVSWYECYPDRTSRPHSARPDVSIDTKCPRGRIPEGRL